MAQLQQITFEADNPCLASLIVAGRPGSINLGGSGRTHELYKGWGFHVETFRIDQRRSVLIEKQPSVEIEVAFERSVNLNIRTPNGAQTINHVRSIHIDGLGYVNASTPSDANPTPTQQPAEQSWEQVAPQPAQQPTRQPANAQAIDSLKKALAECRAKLNDAISERDSIKQENDRLKDQNRMLQNSLNEQLTELERSMTREGLKLDASLKKTLNKVHEQKTKNEKLRQSLTKAESEKNAILGLRDDLREEMDAARERLEEILDRFGADSDILTLMQEEPFLKGTSVRKLLDEAEKTLDRAEQRIGAVVQLRERINSTLLNTILSPSADGTVPMDDEFGGNRNGIRSSATTAD